MENLEIEGSRNDRCDSVGGRGEHSFTNVRLPSCLLLVKGASWPVCASVHLFLESFHQMVNYYGQTHWTQIWQVPQRANPSICLPRQVVFSEKSVNFGVWCEFMDAEKPLAAWVWVSQSFLWGFFLTIDQGKQCCGSEDRMRSFIPIAVDAEYMSEPSLVRER